MARIAGINIPLNKRVEIGLTYIYGIGRSHVQRPARRRPDIDPDTYVRDLTESEVTQAARPDRHRHHSSRAICGASATRTSSA